MSENLKYKIGDKVTHKFRPQWGIGTVVEIGCGGLGYDANDEGVCTSGDVEDCVDVEYPHWTNDPGSEPRIETWYTKVSHLIPVE
jgi:hypothetical protein